MSKQSYRMRAKPIACEIKLAHVKSYRMRAKSIACETKLAHVNKIISHAGETKRMRNPTITCVLTFFFWAETRSELRVRGTACDDAMPGVVTGVPQVLLDARTRHDIRRCHFYSSAWVCAVQDDHVPPLRIPRARLLTLSSVRQIYTLTGFFF